MRAEARESITPASVGIESFVIMDSGLARFASAPE
jgi:hypothetical protein